MQYLYEVLTPDRFQELCQALIVKRFPNTNCFPVGQADGGRDAVSAERLAENQVNRRTVFQVKFRRTLKAQEDIYGIVTSALNGELPKIRRLVARGATEYVLVTNLSGSGALDVGARDRVAAFMEKCIDIPCSVWWREDLDANLNDAYDIKWSFSEILSSSDMLRKLVEED